MRVVDCKWVFKVKENPNGSVNKYKANLVTKGFHQKFGFDYNETSSLMVKHTTIRFILTVAITHKWELQQFGTNIVFLNGTLV